MNTFRNCTRALSTILVAGALLLATNTVAAQQEVAPDHFDGPAATQKAQPKVRKVAAHKNVHTGKHVAAVKKTAASSTDAAGK